MPAWVESLRSTMELDDAPATLLGILVSGPPLAPHRLVRQVRRALLGPGTLHLEADLCDSEHVETISKDGIELNAEFRRAARLLLRTYVLDGLIPVDELRAATQCAEEELSPLLLLEEQMVWAYFSQQDPRPECDRLLTDCLLTIVREDRHRILDWAAAAIYRLPDEVLDTPAAWLLSEVCTALRHKTRWLKPPSMDRLKIGLLQEVLTLVPPTLVGFVRDGAVLRMGGVDREKRLAFQVPAIALRPVTVTWMQDEHPHEETVDVMRESASIPVGAAAVRLRNAAGGVIHLDAFEPGAKPPELGALDEMLDRLEAAWSESRPIRAQVVRAVSPFGAVVRFVDADAVSGYLRLERDHVEEQGMRTFNLVGQEIYVRISNFNRGLQRIMCRPAPKLVEQWSAGNLAAGMDVVGRLVNAVNFGVFVSLPTTEQGLDGPTVDGLVHTSEFPATWLREGPPHFEVGDPISVRIRWIDHATQRIQLTVPIDGLLEQHPEGSTVVGQVVKVVAFGVFVRLPSGVEALLHVSEIAADRVLNLGDDLTVRVMAIDHERQRISLSTEPRIAEGTPVRKTMPPVQPGPTAKPGPMPTKPRTRAATGREVKPVADFLRAYLSGLDQPIAMATLAIAVKNRFGNDVSGDWLGYRKFSTMLTELVPEVRIDPTGPGLAHLL